MIIKLWQHFSRGWLAWRLDRLIQMLVRSQTHHITQTSTHIGDTSDRLSSIVFLVKFNEIQHRKNRKEGGLALKAWRNQALPLQVCFYYSIPARFHYTSQEHLLNEFDKMFSILKVDVFARYIKFPEGKHKFSESQHVFTLLNSSYLQPEHHARIRQNAETTKTGRASKTVSVTQANKSLYC